MITIDQAKQLQRKDTVEQTHEQIETVNDGKVYKRRHAKNWKINGKIKLWKRSPERFQLPLKHGLYDYAYLTNENAHLFQLID